MMIATSHAGNGPNGRKNAQKTQIWRSRFARRKNPRHKRNGERNWRLTPRWPKNAPTNLQEEGKEPSSPAKKRKMRPRVPPTSMPEPWRLKLRRRKRLCQNWPRPSRGNEPSATRTKCSKISCQRSKHKSINVRAFWSSTTPITWTSWSSAKPESNPLVSPWTS